MLLFIGSLVIITLFFSLGHYAACTGMLNKKWNMKIFLLYFGIVFFFQLIVNIILSYILYRYSDSMTDMQSLLFNIIYGFVFSFYPIILALFFSKKYQIKYLQTLFVSALSYFLVFSCQLSISDILLENADILFKNMDEVTIEVLIVLIPHFGLLLFGYLLWFIAKKFKVYRYLSVSDFTKVKTIVYSVLIFFFLNPSIFLPFLMPKGDSGVRGAITVVAFSLNVLIAILVMGNIFQSQKKMEMQNALIAQQTAYMEAMKGLHTEMRTFRHDFQNLMMGVGVHLSADDLVGVKCFMEDMSIYFDKRIGEEFRYWESLMNIDNPLLKNLLAVKLTKMQNDGIAVALEIPTTVKKINMLEEDFIRCMGILLDNAAEATHGIKNGAAKLLFLQEKNQLTAIVENNFAEYPQIPLLYNKGYTTKGEGHGIGLTSYRAILKRYDNISSRTYCENGMFIQEMRIFK